MKSLVAVASSSEEKSFHLTLAGSKKVVGEIRQTEAGWLWKIFGAHPSVSLTLASAQIEAEVAYNRLFG